MKQVLGSVQQRGESDLCQTELRCCRVGYLSRNDILYRRLLHCSCMSQAENKLYSLSSMGWSGQGYP